MVQSRAFAACKGRQSSPAENIITTLKRFLPVNLLSFQPSPLGRLLARAFLRLIAWRVGVNLPESPKYVLVGAPHTSGWDLLLALLFMQAAGIKLHWIGKDSLFRWPLGGAMRWLGGIPVDRRRRSNFVDQVVEVFDRSEDFVVAIAPEGTRSKSDYWKTGFYYIALGAGVPIALGYIDSREKTVGIGPSLTPSGDLQADFALIKKFYAGKQGVRPDLQGEVKLRAE